MKIKKITVIKLDEPEIVYDITVKNILKAQNFKIKSGSIFLKNCGPSCHSGVLSSGSSTVFAEGRAVGRKGDSVSCGSKVLGCSSEVYIG